jgi:hypothetical protein
LALTRGAAICSNGGWWGTLGFDDPTEVETIRRRLDASVDGTTEALEGLDDRLVRRLADSEEAALTAIAERRWEKALGAAVSWTVRSIESTVPVGMIPSWLRSARGLGRGAHRPNVWRRHERGATWISPPSTRTW